MFTAATCIYTLHSDGREGEGEGYTTARNQLLFVQGNYFPSTPISALSTHWSIPVCCCLRQNQHRLLAALVRSFMQDTPKCVCLEEGCFWRLIRVVLSKLQRSRQGKAGWGRGNGGGGSVPELFVILPVVNELFTLAFHQASIFLPDLSAACSTETAGGLWVLCSVFIKAPPLLQRNIHALWSSFQPPPLLQRDIHALQCSFQPPPLLQRNIHALQCSFQPLPLLQRNMHALQWSFQPPPLL